MRSRLLTHKHVHLHADLCACTLNWTHDEREKPNTINQFINQRFFCAASLFAFRSKPLNFYWCFNSTLIFFSASHQLVFSPCQRIDYYLLALSICALQRVLLLFASLLCFRVVPLARFTLFGLISTITSILASFFPSSLSTSKTALELNFSLPFFSSRRSPLSAHSFVIFCAPLTAITFSSSFLSRLFLLLSHLTRSTFAALIFSSLPSLFFSLPTLFSPRRWRSSALTRRLYANWWLWLLLLLPPWTLFSSLPFFLFLPWSSRRSSWVQISR